MHEQQKRGLPTALAAHAYLGVWFNWIIDEQERTTVSLVLRQDRPKLPKKIRKYVNLEEVGRLLEVCKGSDFASRRDSAIIRVLFDNGVRVSGLTGLHLDDVDLQGHRLRITLKGGDEHWAPIGAKRPAACSSHSAPNAP
ncbi:tyrosine-type recombinase/integrase [Nonomuraea polychroma]|uniref:tyrosine-type recombinase/integrase n=1 Tax=Nonomuraea polychroma TaxID=46176 RepID=UPI000FDD1B9E|nr:tyrosine-type recombinase/integrase [Nonomuraea polychroma]